MNTYYKITHHEEEFRCTVCGAPLYIGATAYEADAGIFCSMRCANRDEKPEPGATPKPR